MTYASEAPDARFGYLGYTERCFIAYLRHLHDDRHPVPTKQGFDFHMNLVVYV